MSSRAIRTVVFALVCTAAAGASAQEQEPIVISGTIRDSSSAVVAGATVEVFAGHDLVGRVTTDATGRYRAPLRPRTENRVVVAKEGFSTQTLALEVDQAPLARDIMLAIEPYGDAVVVTASGTAMRRSTANESIAVFDQGQVRAMGANSLADVVRAVPGLNIESTGREGSLASLFTRGGESDYNMVMIDGVRANISGGRFNFSRISAGEIDRVEVVRGAQSSLYGSAAIGAVVHVVTRRADPNAPPRLTGNLEAGSFNARRGQVSLLGGALKRFDYKAGASYRASDGAFKDLLPEPDRYQQVTFDGGAGVTLPAAARLRLAGRYSDANGRSVGPIVYGSRDTGTRFDSRDRQISGTYQQPIGSSFEQTATVAYFDSESVSVDDVVDPAYFLYAILEGRTGARFPDSPRLVRLIDRTTYQSLLTQTLPTGQYLVSTPTGVSDSRFSSRTPFRRHAIDYRADVTWGGGQVLSAGYEYERERNPARESWLISNHAYFAQQQFKVHDRWFMTLGARLDDNTRFGREASPKASVGGLLIPYTAGRLSSLRAYANVGRGIKNPVFDELFGTAFADGNPALHPERARTVDGGVEATFANQRVLARVTYFDNSFQDQVAFLSTGPGLDGRPDYVNIEGSKAHGWEIELGLQRPLAGVTASIGYALVDTGVTATVSTSDQFQPGQPLLRRPKNSIVGQARYANGRLAAALTSRWIGERHDSAFMPLRTVPEPGFPTGRAANITVNPAYAWFGATAEYRLHPAVSVYLAIDNLADKAYESALGYPGQPRSVVAGTRWDLSRRTPRSRP
jgi:outer membrane cobalamin receptor